LKKVNPDKKKRTFVITAMRTEGNRLLPHRADDFAEPEGHSNRVKGKRKKVRRIETYRRRTPLVFPTIKEK